MWRHTSLRVGGPADVWAAPFDIGSLQALVLWCQRQRLPVMVIGDGTNLLVTDAGIRGVVVSLKKLKSDFRIQNDDDTAISVATLAGSRLASLCRFALEQELAAMNFALGIPGTLGGAIRMNAGTPGGAMGDIVDSVTLMSPTGHMVCARRDQLDFSYRHLSWSTDLIPIPVKQAIIVKACLRLPRRNTSHAGMDARQILGKRRAGQPWAACSAGCFFKNPPTGHPAGRLIEMAGLKGMRIGNAQVSTRHANFIINTAKSDSPGSATDIFALMNIIKQRVFSQFNIRLETEVKIAGVFQEKDGQQI